MSEARSDRRTFMKTSAAVALALMGPAIVGVAVGASEQEEHATNLSQASSKGHVMDASVTEHCGTCEFWGGARRLSQDRKQLTFAGVGWCNNPASPNYQKQTNPNHGPMNTWQKWSVLG